MIDAWLEPLCEPPFRCKCRDSDCEGCDYDDIYEAGEDMYERLEGYMYDQLADDMYDAFYKKLG